MKKFGIENSCLKCGYVLKDAFIEYKVGIFDKATQENVPLNSFGESIDEYLLRTCQRCGYKWPEMILDKCLEKE